MASRKDIILGVVIGGAFLLFLFMFAAMIIGGLGSSDSELSGFAAGNVGVVEIDGVIDEEAGRKMIKQIDRWAKSESIEAIILHINTPGGGVAIAQEIYDAVRRAKEEKPVVASMASVAASAGYYIACASDRIVANPGTITGSIGVIFQFHTADGLLEKVGIGTEVIKSGNLKDVGSYARPMTEAEGLMLRSVVMDTYEQFIDVVASNRGLEPDQVYPLADGSIFTGLQAKNLGLVDTLGGLFEASYLAADLAGIVGEPRLVRHTERRTPTLWDLFGTAIFGEKPPFASLPTIGPELLYLYK